MGLLEGLTVEGSSMGDSLVGGLGAVGILAGEGLEHLSDHGHATGAAN